MDAGEALVMRRLAERARGQPILDLGVGGGRTVPYLTSLGGDYVAADYLPEMVALTRSRYPGVRVERMDARDLSGFDAGAFSVVVFSFNGMDGVGHRDRRTIFAEVHRVLRPGGLFAYSTRNLDHESVGRLPIDPDWRRLARSPARALRHAVRLPRRIREYRQTRTLVERGKGWAMLPHPGYDLSVFVFHHVSLPRALEEVREADFDPEVEIYGSEGAALDRSAGTSQTVRFHVIARKP